MSFLLKNTIDVIYFVCASLMIFLASVLSVLKILNSSVFEPAWYVAESTGAVSGYNCSMRYFSM